MTLTKGNYNIVWTGSTFGKIFGSVFVTPKKCKIATKILERPMNDKEILSKLKPKEFSLDEFAYVLKNKKGLLTNGYTNIFYIRDATHTLWAVNANWGGGGWLVSADSVVRPYEWGGDNQVIACDSFGSSSEPLDSRSSESLACPSCHKKLLVKLEVL